jgi:IclR family transcriptional regulator, pca regulon regulatory protein
MTIAEVAVRTGVPRTAARRHLLSLCHFGYASSDGKHFWLTPRVLRLGQSYLEAARLPRLVRPFIQQLSMSVGETVNVSVLDGHDVVYVARSNSPRMVSIGFQLGDRVPAHVVSPGPLLLSALDEAAAQAWIDGHDFAGFTPDTVTGPAEFGQRVKLARERGWSVSHGQLDAGLTGVSVALKNRRGHCHAALGMTVQSLAWTAEQITDRLVPALLATAQSLRPVI